MSHLRDDPTTLKALQEAIYRDRIRLARARTFQQRLAGVVELSKFMFGMMHAGAMNQLGTTDELAGWEEVRRWMKRLDRAREHGFYVTAKPAGA